MSTTKYSINPPTVYGIALKHARSSKSDERVEIQASELSTELRNSLMMMWQDGTLSDLTVVSRDQEFKVHKIVMASHSVYFKKALTHPTDHKELASGEFSLDEDPELLQLAFEFLYKGRVVVGECLLAELKALAERLQLDHLVDHCQGWMLANGEITEENCLEAWVTAVRIHDDKLLALAKPKALASFPHLQHRGSSIEDLPIECLKNYMGHPDLECHSPDERLVAALKWIDKSPDERSQHICDILQSLPLHDMDWYLAHALYCKLVQNDPQAKQLLQEALDQRSCAKPLHDERKVERCLIVVVPKEDVYGDVGEDDNVSEDVNVSKDDNASTDDNASNDDNVSEDDISSDKEMLCAVRLEAGFQLVPLGEMDQAATSAIAAQNHMIYYVETNNGVSRIMELDVRDYTSHVCCRLPIPVAEYCIVPSKEKNVFYIIGADNPDEGKPSLSSSDTSTGSVYTFDCRKCTVGCIGNLETSGNMKSIMACLSGNDNDIIVCLNKEYTTSLLSFSLVHKKVTQDLVASDSFDKLCGIVERDGKILLFENGSTVLCTWNPKSYTLNRPYVPPYEYCAVVPWEDEQMFLVGGKVNDTIDSDIDSDDNDDESGDVTLRSNTVFSAHVQLVADKVWPGWQPHTTAYRGSGYRIKAYCTSHLATELLDTKWEEAQSKLSLTSDVADLGMSLLFD